MYKKHISKLAISSMLKELDLIDKPGLVSPVSNGNHSDMDYFLMRRGIKALRKYFYDAFDLGFFNRDFKSIRELGKRYETKMFNATNGINTHKGAVFQLGILVYLIGRIKSRGIFITNNNFREEILFEIDRLNLKELKKESRFGARKEVFDGFYLSFKALNYNLSDRIYFIMSKIHDTNIIRRGGENLLFTIQRLSKDVLNNKNKEKLYDIINKNNLSPGGAADILINSIFIEDFFKYENEYLKNLKTKILNTKEYIGSFGYSNKIILSLVFPGFIKTNEKFLKYFNHYKDIMDKRFKLIKEIHNETGYRAIYNIKPTEDFYNLKNFTVELEKNSLIDIDIYGDKVYDRKYFNLPQRKCLICNDTSKSCMINKKHSIDKIIEKSLEIINEN